MIKLWLDKKNSIGLPGKFSTFDLRRELNTKKVGLAYRGEPEE